MPIKTISRDELIRKLKNGENVLLVNVLSPQDYHLGSIRGSLRIPLAELNQRYGELDAKREVITYGAGRSSTASGEAAQFLDKKGFLVRAYEGGLDDWKAAALPLEESKVVALEQPSGLSGMAEPARARHSSDPLDIHAKRATTDGIRRKL